MKQSYPSTWVCVCLTALLLAGSVPVQASTEPLKARTSKTDFQKTFDWEKGEMAGKPYKPNTELTRQADALLAAGKLDAAEKAYKDLIAKYPKAPEPHRGLGNVYRARRASFNQLIRKQDYSLSQEAAGEFLSALRYAPNYMEAMMDLGSTYLDQGRKSEAYDVIRQAWSYNPGSDVANERLGTAILEQGYPNDALPFFQQANRANPNNAAAHYGLGTAHRMRGQMTPAYDALQRSLSLQPRSAPTHHQLGLLYNEQGNPALAINAFKKALDIQPDYGPSNRIVGEFYEKRGDSAQALEYYKLLADSQPVEKPLLTHIAELAVKNSQPEVAERYYRRLLDEDPNNPVATRGLARTMSTVAMKTAQGFSLKDQAKAQQLAKKALEVDSDDLEARLVRSQVQGGSRSLEQFDKYKAEALLNKTSYKPGENLTKGELLYARFNPEQGDKAYAAALNVTDNPDDIVTMGNVLITLGQPDHARNAFHRLMGMSVDKEAREAAQLGMTKVSQQLRQSDSLVRDAEQNRRLDPNTRLATLDDALRINRRNSRAYYLKATLLEDNNRIMEAIQNYRAYSLLTTDLKVRLSMEKKIQKLSTQLVGAYRP